MLATVFCCHSILKKDETAWPLLFSKWTETKADDGVQQNVGFLHICQLNFCSFHWICYY